MLYAESCAFYDNIAEDGGAVCVGRLSLADVAFSYFHNNRALHSGKRFLLIESTMMSSMPIGRHARPYNNTR